VNRDAVQHGVDSELTAIVSQESHGIRPRLHAAAWVDRVERTAENAIHLIAIRVSDNEQCPEPQQDNRLLG